MVRFKFQLEHLSLVLEETSIFLAAAVLPRLVVVLEFEVDQVWLDKVDQSKLQLPSQKLHLLVVSLLILGIHWRAILELLISHLVMLQTVVDYPCLPATVKCKVVALILWVDLVLLQQVDRSLHVLEKVFLALVVQLILNLVQLLNNLGRLQLEQAKQLNNLELSKF